MGSADVNILNHLDKDRDRCETECQCFDSKWIMITGKVNRASITLCQSTEIKTWETIALESKTRFFKESQLNTGLVHAREEIEVLVLKIIQKKKGCVHLICSCLKIYHSDLHFQTKACGKHS